MHTNNDHSIFDRRYLPIAIGYVPYIYTRVRTLVWQHRSNKQNTRGLHELRRDGPPWKCNSIVTIFCSQLIVIRVVVITTLAMTSNWPSTAEQRLTLMTRNNGSNEFHHQHSTTVKKDGDFTTRISSHLTSNWRRVASTHSLEVRGLYDRFFHVASLQIETGRHSLSCYPPASYYYVYNASGFTPWEGNVSQQWGKWDNRRWSSSSVHTASCCLYGDRVRSACLCTCWWDLW